jgi:hypothetical protein
MSKREREAERKLGNMPKLKTGKVHSGARAEYWTLHEKPTKKKRRGTGLEHRLRKDDASLLQKIHTLGAKSDSVVIREKPENLVRNLAFVQHQQKLYGAIRRFAKSGWPHSLPKRVEAIVQRTAFVTTEKR